MVNIQFMEKYLKNKILKKSIVILRGIINLNINILKFNFEINGNNLKLKDENNEILKIVFNEVKDVIKNKEDNIVINFNINERIIIK